MEYKRKIIHFQITNKGEIREVKDRFSILHDMKLLKRDDTQVKY